MSKFSNMGFEFSKLLFVLKIYLKLQSYSTVFLKQIEDFYTEIRHTYFNTTGSKDKTTLTN